MLSIVEARQNRILDLLSPVELTQLLPSLEKCALPVKTLMQARGQSPELIYFPTSGVGSMITLTEAGDLIEVATVGYEGLTGLSLFLGGHDAALETIMQVPGEGLRMEAAAFQRACQLPSVVRVLHLYTQALLTQIAQGSACNRVHSIEQRCARWLLQSHDRTREAHFELTQEFLAIMLGTRRAAVNEVAGTLQDRGLIHYHRGVISVLDRAGLEVVSCACYALIANAYNRLLGVEHGTRPS